MRILDLASKDLLQNLRDRKTFIFLLLMPIIFTLLFGFAFGGFGGGQEDARLPVGFLDLDGGRLSLELERLLRASEVVRIETEGQPAVADLEKKVADEKIAAALIVPAGYSDTALTGEAMKLALIVDTASDAGLTIQGAVQTAANRLMSAVRTAQIATQNAGADQAFFDATLEKALAAWQEPPISLTVTKTGAITEDKEGPTNAFSHTAPGMMLQFAIAGLIGAAQVLVNERKSRTLQRLLTTAISRTQILFGHFLAIFVMILMQLAILIAFGQIILKLDYLRQPLATVIMVVTTALFVAGLGLLIGALAKTDEQAVMFALIPMFVFAGLGGAWVPLEYTGRTLQIIGHITPVAWAMDGFENIVARGLDLNWVWLPAGALLGYAVLFFGLAAWRFRFE